MLGFLFIHSHSLCMLLNMGAESYYSCLFNSRKYYSSLNNVQLLSHKIGSHPLPACSDHISPGHNSFQVFCYILRIHFELIQYHLFNCSGKSSFAFIIWKFHHLLIKLLFLILYYGPWFVMITFFVNLSMKNYVVYLYVE